MHQKERNLDLSPNPWEVTTMVITWSLHFVSGLTYQPSWLKVETIRECGLIRIQPTSVLARVVATCNDGFRQDMSRRLQNQIYPI